MGCTLVSRIMYIYIYLSLRESKPFIKPLALDLLGGSFRWVSRLRPVRNGGSLRG